MFDSQLDVSAQLFRKAGKFQFLSLFVGEKSYTEINIPLRGGDDLFLHGNKDAGCIGYFSGSEVLLFGSYGLFARDDDSRYLLTKERR